MIDESISINFHGFKPLAVGEVDQFSSDVCNECKYGAELSSVNGDGFTYVFSHSRSTTNLNNGKMEIRYNGKFFMKGSDWNGKDYRCDFTISQNIDPKLN